MKSKIDRVIPMQISEENLAWNDPELFFKSLWATNYKVLPAQVTLDKSVYNLRPLDLRVSTRSIQIFKRDQKMYPLSDFHTGWNSKYKDLISVGELFLLNLEFYIHFEHIPSEYMTPSEILNSKIAELSDRTDSQSLKLLLVRFKYVKPLPTLTEKLAKTKKIRKAKSEIDTCDCPTDSGIYSCKKE
jgi:hypothetical protein